MSQRLLYQPVKRLSGLPGYRNTGLASDKPFHEIYGILQIAVTATVFYEGERIRSVRLDEMSLVLLFFFCFSFVFLFFFQLPRFDRGFSFIFRTALFDDATSLLDTYVSSFSYGLTFFGCADKGERLAVHFGKRK